MQDIFYEHTIKRAEIPNINTLYFVCVGFTGANVLAAIMIWPPMIVMAVLFGVLSYVVNLNRSVEYDYAYTNGNLEIAKVRNGEKRKQLLELKSDDIVVMAKTGASEVLKYKGRAYKSYDCTSHTNKDYYVLVFKKNNRDAKLLFEPGEEILDILKRTNGNKVYA
jgi:hypothetical protein